MPRPISVVQHGGTGKKKRWFLHFCVDFCRFNVHTKKDSYPLPQIQEALESKVGVAHFSMIDFKSIFWQLKMVPGSQQYTTFTMGNLGFYKFRCMPFWALQCSLDFSMPHAKHSGGAEPDILCHLLG